MQTTKAALSTVLSIASASRCLTQSVTSFDRLTSRPTADAVCGFLSATGGQSNYVRLSAETVRSLAKFSNYRRRRARLVRSVRLSFLVLFTENTDRQTADICHAGRATDTKGSFVTTARFSVEAPITRHVPVSAAASTSRSKN
jgi:hypothetical protein